VDERGPLVRISPLVSMTPRPRPWHPPCRRSRGPTNPRTRPARAAGRSSSMICLVPMRRRPGRPRHHRHTRVAPRLSGPPSRQRDRRQATAKGRKFLFRSIPAWRWGSIRLFGGRRSFFLRRRLTPLSQEKNPCTGVPADSARASPRLDLVLGGGLQPPGRRRLICGPAGSGKTAGGAIAFRPRRRRSPVVFATSAKPTASCSTALQASLSRRSGMARLLQVSAQPG